MSVLLLVTLLIVSLVWQKQKRGLSADLAATSCAEILRYKPHSPSGYYWLQSTSSFAIYVFCDMTLTCKEVSGGWMQVVNLDMTNSSHQCPPGTTLRTDLPRRLCGIGISGLGCSSTILDTRGIAYSQVCGKIIGYQYWTPDGFGNGRSHSIDGAYVDGISLTHGSSPRQHIWTFAAALDEVGTYRGLICPCIDRNLASSATPPPSFVGNDYFCDTGSEDHFQAIFYGDDPLWDGAGCGPLNDCCDLNNPPWFRKQLLSATTDDIEMRICREAAPDEDTPIEIIEIYVQ